jgi:hypothetical protein
MSKVCADCGESFTGLSFTALRENYYSCSYRVAPKISVIICIKCAEKCKHEDFQSLSQAKLNLMEARKRMSEADNMIRAEHKKNDEAYKNGIFPEFPAAISSNYEQAEINLRNAREQYEKIVKKIGLLHST